MRHEKENYKSILTEEIDNEILLQMPLWFRRLRETYVKKEKDVKSDVNSKL